MPKYVIHKKCFYYDDSFFQPTKGNSKGSVVGIFNDLEEAKKAKIMHDITSMQRLSGVNAVDYFPSDQVKYHKSFKEFIAFYKAEFGVDIYGHHEIYLPGPMSIDHAKSFLEMMFITFHDIVEYGDEEDIPEDPDFSEGELMEY
jgi:hypothetical protein